MKKIFTAAIAAAAAAMMISAGVYAENAEKVDANGLVVEIPAEFKDLLTIQTEDLDPDTFISVSETASIEASKANGEDYDGAGWLFSISRVPENEMDQMRCNDMSGMEVFAEDDDFYYVFNHPTDVRMVRGSNEEMTKDMDQWTQLNEWASANVRDSILADNPQLDLETFSNTNLDMYLCRAAFAGDIQYEVRSLEFGGEAKDMTGLTDIDAIEELANDAYYEIADDAEEPAGEYIVLAFPEDDVRYDFFNAPGYENLIREVRTIDDEEYVTMYRATFDDPEDTAGGIMQEWVHEILNGDVDD